jgi:hypothetical protein
VQCAWAATRTKGTYLHAQFHRIRARRGPKKAILAVAASILTAIYHMLKDGTLYQDPGPNYLNARNKERQKNRLIKRLADLGYVGVEPPPPATAPTVDVPNDDGAFVPAELFAGAVVVSPAGCCVCALRRNKPWLGARVQRVGVCRVHGIVESREDLA